MSVTSKDVARRASVSPITVSRVFNPRPGFPIALATRERVFAAARELGYQPNRLARALVTGRTRSVTLHVPELTSYHAQVVRSIHALLARDRYAMVMMIDDFRTLPEAPPTGDRGGLPSDGTLAVDPVYRTDLSPSADDPGAPPLIRMGTHVPADGGFVVVDLKAGAAEATRHLAERGARRIGFVVPEFANHAGDARRDGYDLALREAAKEPCYYPITWPTREAARAEMAEHLSTGPLPDALFCYSDDCAIGTFAALRARGLSVPDDILLCGCDGLSDAEYLTVPLTTVSQPLDTMCERAWEMLRERIENPTAPLRQEILPPRLIVRESTRR